MVESATKLFKLTDVEKTGFVSMADCKKIIRALKLNVNYIPALLVEPISLEALVDVANHCNGLFINSTKLEHIFVELGKDASIEIMELFPDIDIKHIPVSDGNRLDFSVIIGVFNN